MHATRLLLYSFLLFGLSARSQFSSSFVLTPLVGNEVLDECAMDVNGDGAMDVVYLGHEGFSISLNDGDGTFRMPYLRPMYDQPNVIRAADFDLDGDQDILLAVSDNDSGLVWLANDGTGQFGPIRVLPGGSCSSCSLFVLDIDQDGLPDVYKNGSSGINYFLNNWPGPFSASQYVDGSQYNARMVDIDLDQDLDIVAKSSMNDLTLQRDTGQGFEPMAQTFLPPAPDVFSFDVRDIDLDGDTDLVVDFDTELAVYLNDTMNGFASPLLIPTDVFSIYSMEDVNSDGYPDVVAFGPSLGFYTHINNGAGGFGTSLPLGLLDYDDLVNSFHLADFNGDARNDLLHRIFIDGGLAWCPNVDSTSFSRPQAVVPSGTGAPSSGDMDGDGDVDVLLNGAWVEQSSPGVFDRVHTTDLDARNHAPADLSDDGLMDTYTFHTTYEDLYWCRNTGQGFDPPALMAYNGTGYLMAMAWDPDSDGDNDLLDVNLNLRGYENDGTGNFSLVPNSLGACYGLLLPGVADFDGDGDPDLVEHVTDELRVQYNQGNWDFFVTHDVIGTFVPEVRYIRTGDLDLDGDPDILFEQDGELKWYANNGVGNPWTAHTMGVDVYSTAFAFDLGDLDGDGDLDITCTRDSLSWLENDGNGTFLQPQAIPADLDAYEVRMNDLDGDGASDLILINLNRVWIMLTGLGVGEQEGDAPVRAHIHVFPNPITDGATVVLDSPLASGASLEMMDIFGRVVRRWSGPLPGRIEIDTQGASKGTYVLRHTHSSGAEAIPVIIQ